MRTDTLSLVRELKMLIAYANVFSLTGDGLVSRNLDRNLIVNAEGDELVNRKKVRVFQSRFRSHKYSCNT